MCSIRGVYDNLFRKYGPQHWWPCKGEKYGNEEIAIGAILTQNTSWSNVEKALDNLRSAGLLSLERLTTVDVDYLRNLIRPAGFFNQKSKYLMCFSNYVVRNYGSLKRFFDEHNDTPIQKVRKELLSIKGVGKETADSILLYAGFRFIFVVDAYTKRFFSALNLIDSPSVPYDDVRVMVEKELHSVEELQEFHALIVREMKEVRKRKKDI